MEIISTVIMLIGLASTVSPRLPGHILILAGAVLYLSSTGFNNAPAWLIYTLLCIAVTAEGGGRLLRLYLTKSFSLSRSFCVNVTAGNIGGSIAANAILGPLVGLVLWELLVGKTFLPRWSIIGQVLGCLLVVGLLRFFSGLAMIVLTAAFS